MPCSSEEYSPLSEEYCSNSEEYSPFTREYSSLFAQVRNDFRLGRFWQKKGVLVGDITIMKSGTVTNFLERNWKQSLISHFLDIQIPDVLEFGLIRMAPNNNTKREFTRKKLIGFSVLTTLLILLTFEGLVRLVDKIGDGYRSRRMEAFRQTDVVLKWAPHIDFKPVPGYNNGTLIINEDGYRGKRVSVEKSPGTIRLVCLGGSTTMEANLSLAQTYPEVLRKMLESKIGGANYEVLNAGCAGYMTVESINRLELELLDYAPDFVLIMHGLNDLRANWYSGYKSDYSHIYPIPDFFFDETPIGKLMRKIRYGCSYSMLCASWLPDISKSTERALYAEANPKFYSVGAFRRNMQSLVFLSKSVNATPVLATMALSFDSTNPPPVEKLNEFFRPPKSSMQLYEGLKLHNEITRDVAAKNNAPLVDLDAEMPRSMDYYDDECHFNYKGAELVAEKFFNAIEPILKPAPSGPAPTP